MKQNQRIKCLSAGYFERIRDEKSRKNVSESCRDDIRISHGNDIASYGYTDSMQTFYHGAEFY